MADESRACAAHSTNSGWCRPACRPCSGHRSSGRPRLICPKNFGAVLMQSKQDAVLAHELAHWKRCDHWVRRLESIVLGLYWWYPGAWWARRRLERAEEECCDAWVVWALPSIAGAYAEALVATAAFLSGYRNSLPLGASGAGCTRPLKRRLNMILCDRSAGPVAHATPLVVLARRIIRIAIPAGSGLSPASRFSWYSCSGSGSVIAGAGQSESWTHETGRKGRSTRRARPSWLLSIRPSPIRKRGSVRRSCVKSVPTRTIREFSRQLIRSNFGPGSAE